MKLAIIGSRNLHLNIEPYLPHNITEIISGGAIGIDSLAEKYADKMKLSKHIIRPEYKKYGLKAPIIRNKDIIEKSDMIIAFWDGNSRGTLSSINYAKKIGKNIKIIEVNQKSI